MAEAPQVQRGGAPPVATAAPAPTSSAPQHAPVTAEAPQVQPGTAAPAFPSAAPQTPAAPPLTDRDVFEALDIVRALLAQAQGTRRAVRSAMATVPGVFPTVRSAFPPSLSRPPAPPSPAPHPPAQALALYSNLLAGATGVASSVTAAVRSGLVLPLIAALAEASHRWAETLGGALRPFLLRAGISPTDLDAALALGLAQAPQAGPWMGGRGHGRGQARWAPAAPASAAPAAAPAPVAAAAGPAVHADVTCDACGVRPLTGARFKCAVCADYDLCAACEASNAWGGGGAAPGVLHERTHAFLKISHPIQTPTAIRIVLAEAHEAGLPAGSTPWVGGGGGGRWGWGHGRGHHGHGRRHWAPEGGAWGDRVAPCGVSEAAPPHAGREAEELAAALRASLVPVPAAGAPTPIAIPSTPPPHSPAAAAGFEHVAPSPLGSSSPAPSHLPYNARFIAHLTLSSAGEPAAKVHPSQAIVKAWRVKNDGPAAWPQGCRLVCVGGGWAAMGGPDGGLALPPAPPCTTVDVALPLVAPNAPGRYQSYWRIQAPAPPAEAGGSGPDSARLFGARLWVDLFVEGEAPACAPAGVPLPSPAPSSVLGALAAMRMSMSDTTPSSPGSQGGAQNPVLWEGTSAAWTASLASLSAMGFGDTQAAVAALAGAGGSLEGAVSALVAANEGPASEPASRL
jgi:hypothetical protein